MFNRNMNKYGQNRPMCNNRQYGTVGFIQHHQEEMNLKPEYLGNEHLKFVNNFGLHNNFNTDKKFVEINNLVNHDHNQFSNHRMALKPSHITSYSVPNIVCPPVPHTNFNNSFSSNHKNRQRFAEDISTKVTDTIRTSETMTQNTEKPNKEFNKSDPIPNNTKHPKKNKRNSKAICDNKGNQKAAKKSKKQKNFHKQSKKESDRNIVNNTSPKKRNKNKSKNRKCPKIEIMDFEDIEILSTPDQNSIESPICTQAYIQTLSSPIKFSVKAEITPCSPPRVNQTPSKPIISMECTALHSFRSRLPSECESEDSFIISFEDEDCDMEDDDDDEDTDTYTTSDEDTDDSDVYICTSIKNVGFDDESDGDDEIDFCTTSNRNRGISTSSPNKKVRFVEGKGLCSVHPMIQWSYAYQKARKGPWEQYALDRVRFKNRISKVEPVLNAVLQSSHRSRIFKERFQGDD